jgi:hypothetical protein
VAERLHAVELTESFIARLESIELFLTLEAEAPFAYEDLLSALHDTVLPNLARFPLMGRRYIEHPPQSTEALAKLAKLPTGAIDCLRVYLHADYLLLYSVLGKVVYLLSIRHHRQLSFDFANLWQT